MLRRSERRTVTLINLWNGRIYHFLTFLMIITYDFLHTIGFGIWRGCILKCNRSSSSSHRIILRPRRKCASTEDFAKSIFIYAPHPLPDECLSLFAFCIFVVPQRQCRRAIILVRVPIFQRRLNFASPFRSLSHTPIHITILSFYSSLLRLAKCVPYVVPPACVRAPPRAVHCN